MHNKEWYKKQADKHLRAYYAAVDDDNKAAMKKHEREYINYKLLADSK